MEGEGSIAEGTAAHAEGYWTKASGAYAHAEGNGSKASNTAAHAEGDSTEASGAYAHAEGWTTIARGKAGHCEGANSEIKAITSNEITITLNGAQILHSAPSERYSSWAAEELLTSQAAHAEG